MITPKYFISFTRLIKLPLISLNKLSLIWLTTNAFKQTLNIQTLGNGYDYINGYYCSLHYDYMIVVINTFIALMFTFLKSQSHIKFMF